jgi:hypothetical protein
MFLTCSFDVLDSFVPVLFSCYCNLFHCDYYCHYAFIMSLYVLWENDELAYSFRASKFNLKLFLKKDFCLSYHKVFAFYLLTYHRRFYVYFIVNQRIACCLLLTHILKPLHTCTILMVVTIVKYWGLQVATLFLPLGLVLSILVSAPSNMLTSSPW